MKYIRRILLTIKTYQGGIMLGVLVGLLVSNIWLIDRTSDSNRQLRKIGQSLEAQYEEDQKAREADRNRYRTGQQQIIDHMDCLATFIVEYGKDPNTKLISIDDCRLNYEAGVQNTYFPPSAAAPAQSVEEPIPIAVAPPPPPQPISVERDNPDEPVTPPPPNSPPPEPEQPTPPTAASIVQWLLQPVFSLLELIGGRR